MNIIKLDAIGSTNSYLKDLIKETPLADETIVVARRQTAGRGQQGARWHTQDGKSLTFSMFKELKDVEVKDHFNIAMVVSLGIIRALKGLKLKNITIKWPNDIMADSKKICGILIENTVVGNKILNTVVGIGLNVNETHFENLPFATSMKMSSGITFSSEEVLQKVALAVLSELKKLDSTKFKEIQTEYERELFRRNKIAVYETKDGKKFNGMLKGVSDYGQLFVELDDEQVKTFDLKEIRYCL